MDPELKGRALDVSLSPSGGEVDEIEEEAARQAWYTHMSVGRLRETNERDPHLWEHEDRGWWTQSSCVQ